MINIFCLLSSLILISSKNESQNLIVLEKPPLLKIPTTSSFFVAIVSGIVLLKI